MPARSAELGDAGGGEDDDESDEGMTGGGGAETPIGGPAARLQKRKTIVRYKRVD